MVHVVGVVLLRALFFFLFRSCLVVPAAPERSAGHCFFLITTIDFGAPLSSQVVTRQFALGTQHGVLLRRLRTCGVLALRPARAGLQPARPRDDVLRTGPLQRLRGHPLGEGVFVWGCSFYTRRADDSTGSRAGQRAA